jgi:Holliday junction resolvasome RuvABC endonuclease subunit
VRRYTLGIDLGTNLGICRRYEDGTIEAETIKLKPNLCDRVMGIERVIEAHKGLQCTLVGLEQPFGRNAQALQQLYAMMGASVSACERFLLPWQLVHLSKIKKHATGAGNASKEMMVGAALARWGVELNENAADAAWVADYVAD